MKELYSIGEVSELLNLSTQTLRYYDREGVVVPAYVDPVTGYRKYTYNQINYVERVRYLQKLGLSLKDISIAITGNDTGRLVSVLQKEIGGIDMEIDRLKDLKSHIEWYVDYYRHLDEPSPLGVSFESQFPNRYILAEPIKEGEAPYGTAGARLLRRRHGHPFKDITFLRQVGYLLNFEALCEGRFEPTQFFIYVKEPKNLTDEITTLPGGNYFCVRSKLLSDSPPADPVKDRFSGSAKPKYVIASEYEDNFTDFHDCVYEIQIFI